MNQSVPSPTFSTFPGPPNITPPRAPSLNNNLPLPPYAGHSSPRSTPQKGSAHLSPNKTPYRRRSSIMHTTPSTASPRKYKANGVDGGVDKALDNVMRGLRVFAMGTPRPQYEVEISRWSSSSEESEATAGEEDSNSSFWRSRKSMESSRSKATTKSKKSTKSLKSSKSMQSLNSNVDRMDVDQEVPPPMPVPVTPGRSRRMMEGIVKRLGLTPKKKSMG